MCLSVLSSHESFTDVFLIFWDVKLLLQWSGGANRQGLQIMLEHKRPMDHYVAVIFRYVFTHSTFYSHPFPTVNSASWGSFCKWALRPTSSGSGAWKLGECSMHRKPMRCDEVVQELSTIVQEESVDTGKLVDTLWIHVMDTHGYMMIHASLKHGKPAIITSGSQPESGPSAAHVSGQGLAVGCQEGMCDGLHLHSVKYIKLWYVLVGMVICRYVCCKWMQMKDLH